MSDNNNQPKFAKASRFGLEVLTFLGDSTEYFSLKRLWNSFFIDGQKADYKTLSKTINELRRQGLVDKQRLSLGWGCKINSNGLRYLEWCSRHGRDYIKDNHALPCRTHNLVFAVDIVKRGEHSFRGFSIAQRQMTNWKYPQLTKECSPTVTLQTTDKTLLIRFSQIYGFDSADAVFAAFDRVIEIRSELMRNDCELRLGHPREVASIVQQHHALNMPGLSKWLEKYKINWKDDRLEVDRSCGYPELELIHSTNAQGDFQEVSDFLRAVMDGRFDWRRLCKE